MSLLPPPFTFPPSGEDGESSVEETLGHYRIFRRPDGGLWELGRGAMGVTYKAVDTNLDKPVALKIINGQSIGQENARKRFRREARSAASLHHRHIAGVFHLGESSGSFFYAMEFIDGETVDALVKRDGPLPWRPALVIALQVSRALMAAHAKDLVHRDIKPANIMVVDEVDERGVVKLIDFGLAKSAAEKDGSHSVTNVSGFLGTPLYASPEQCEEIPADIRSDIYSLGVTLWFMLTGEPTFVGTLGKVFHQQMHAAPPWEKLPADLPREARAVLGRMLAKDRADRQQTPTELRTELEQCLQAHGIGGSIPTDSVRTKSTVPPLPADPAGGVFSGGGSDRREMAPPPKLSKTENPSSKPATAPARPEVLAGNVPGPGKAQSGEETVAENAPPPPRPAPSEWRQKKGLIVATALVGMTALLSMGDNSDKSKTAQTTRTREAKVQKARDQAAKLTAAAKKQAAAIRAEAAAMSGWGGGTGKADAEAVGELDKVLQEVGFDETSRTEWRDRFKDFDATVINALVLKVRKIPDLSISKRAKALGGLATAQAKLGDVAASRQTFAEAIQAAESIPDKDESVKAVVALTELKGNAMGLPDPVLPAPPAPSLPSASAEPFPSPPAVPLPPTP